MKSEKNTGKFITMISISIFILSVFAALCTPASAYTIDKSVDVENSTITLTVTGTNDEDASRYPLMQNNGEFGLEISKTVWDPENNRWAKEINAQVGDIVTFQVISVCKNVSQACDEPCSFVWVVIERWPENCGYVDDNVIINEVDDIVYINWTLRFEVEERGEGVNEAWLQAYCYNPETKEYIFIDEVPDTATVNLSCQAPTLTPIGIVALLGLLSLIAAGTIVRKRR